MPGVFVTGTDTEVGKTAVSAAIAAALLGRGLRVGAHKPVLTGEAHPAPGVPHDHELLARITGQQPGDVAPVRFGLPLSPHLAAQMAGRVIDPAALVASARAAIAPVDVLVVEGVGGLLVPLAGAYLIRDFARALDLPVVIAARPGLGTINHTLLTLEAARVVGLDVRAVVMTPWPETPSTMERSNAETIAGLGNVEVAFLPYVDGYAVEAFVTASASLPVERWVG